MKKRFSEECILDIIQGERELLPRIGTRKLYHLLHYKGINIGRDKLYKLLRDNDLLVRPSKRIVIRTTQASRRAYLFRNLVKECFIDWPNQVWVADITYIRLQEGFAYLSLITDAFSRKIIGYCLHSSLDTEGCINALNMAMTTLSWSELNGIIHHSDRGCQYCSKEYVKILRTTKMRVSVTQNGDPYENALAERINGILKTEWINQETFLNLEHAKERIEQIVKLYNTRRLHSAHSYKTPEEIHQKFYRSAKKATKRAAGNSFSAKFVNL